MSRLSQQARIDAAVMAEMAPFKPVALPVDVTGDDFPNIAQARADLAAMSPERRAMLLGEWK